MIGFAHWFDGIGGVLVSVMQKLKRFVDALFGFFLATDPAQRVRRASQQIRCAELRADIGFSLSYTDESVVIDRQSFLRVAVAENITDFKPDGCNRMAAQIVDRVPFRQFFTDV